MKKKEFFKELKNKLSILSEEEIKDIIDEYENIVSDKVKDGKSEEEAIKEFGSIDELVSEILKAYKINPEYLNNNDKKQTVDFSSWVRSGAEYLSNATTNLIEDIKGNGKELSVELIFEIIIKFFVLLIGLLILKIPFEILRGLLDTIFSTNIDPLNNFVHLITSILTGLGYFAIAALLFVIVFKEYFKSDKENYPEKKEEIKKDKEVKKVERKETMKKTDNGFATVINVIYKIFMTMSFIIPSIFAIIGLIIALCFVSYFSIIGIPIYGSIILFLGLIICGFWFVDVLFQITFDYKKINFISLITGVCLTLIGGLVLTTNVFSFSYVNKQLPVKQNLKTVTKTFNISEDANIRYNYNTDLKVDNSLKNDEIKVKITYDKNIIDYKDVILESEDNDEANTYYLREIFDDSFDFNDFKIYYNAIIKGLKQKKVYNLDRNSHLNIEIIGNQKVIDNIR